MSKKIQITLEVDEGHVIYLKEEYGAKRLTIWDIVQVFYPDYSSSDEITQEGDLDRIITGEYEDGDIPDQLLKEEYGGDIDNLQIFTDHDHVLMSIYQKTIAGLIESIVEVNEV